MEQEKVPIEQLQAYVGGTYRVELSTGFRGPEVFDSEGASIGRLKADETFEVIAVGHVVEVPPAEDVVGEIKLGNILQIKHKRFGTKGYIRWGDLTDKTAVVRIDAPDEEEIEKEDAE